MENEMLKSVRVILATSAVFLLLGWAAPADSHQDQQDKGKGQEKRQEQEKPAKQDQPQTNRQQGQQRQQAQAPREQPQHQQRGQQRQQAQAPREQPQHQQRGQQRQQAQAPSEQQQHQQQQAQGQQQRQQQDNSANRQQARTQQDQQRQQRPQQSYRSAQERSLDQARRQQVAWQGERAHSWQSEHRTWQQRGGYNGYRVPEERFRGYYGQDHGFRIYSLPVVYVGGQRRFQYGGYWFGLVDPWPEYWSNDWYDSDDMYVDYSGDGYYLYNRSHPGDRIAISFYVN
jgi:hypothetical protein